MRAPFILFLLAASSCSGWSRYNELEFFFNNENKRTNVIFLTGPEATARTWTFASQDYRILDLANTFTISLPNQGNSFKLQNASLNNYASIIKSFIIQHNLRNVYLVGDYLGGKIAAQTAALYPRMISGLILANSFPFDYGQEYNKDDKEVYTGLKNINLKRNLADIKADLLKLLGTEQYTQIVSSQLLGSEGNYRYAFDLDYFINNIDNLNGAVALKPFFGSVKIFNKKNSHNAPESMVPQLKTYYPKIDLQNDVVFLDQTDYVWSQNVGEITGALAKMIGC